MISKLFQIDYPKKRICDDQVRGLDVGRGWRVEGKINMEILEIEGKPHLAQSMAREHTYPATCFVFSPPRG
jgi:hypothetical protein